MENPLVSVIVPVYNAAAFLPAAVESILAQTYTSWELILIDDGSTDASPAICDTYADANPRIRVIHQPNAGVSAARNAGLRQADGEFISFVDADDLVAPEYLQHLVTQQQRTQADLVGTWREFVDANLTPIPRKPTAIDACYTADNLSQLLRENVHFSTVVWGKLYRKSIITQHQLAFCEELSLGEDDLFISCYISVCNKVVCDSRKLYMYRKHGHSLSDNNPVSWLRQSLHILELCHQFVENNRANVAFFNVFRNRIKYLIIRYLIDTPLTFGQIKTDLHDICKYADVRQWCREFVLSSRGTYRIYLMLVRYTPFIILPHSIYFLSQINRFRHRVIRTWRS